MMTGDIVGVVLAGGRGLRMGGGDKGLVLLGGMAMAEVVVRRLQKQTRAVIINANRNIGAYQKIGCPVVADAVMENHDGASGNIDKPVNNDGCNNNKGGGFDNRKDDKSGGVNHRRFDGPLAGMLAGLRAADGEWVLFVPCDCPFFPLTLARDLLVAAEDKKTDIAVAVADGREQPVFMLARRCLADDLAAFVGGGGRKIDLWYRRLNYAKVLFDDADAFANINTPEELAKANERIKQTSALKKGE